MSHNRYAFLYPLPQYHISSQSLPQITPFCLSHGNSAVADDSASRFHIWPANLQRILIGLVGKPEEEEDHSEELTIGGRVLKWL